MYSSFAGGFAATLSARQFLLPKEVWILLLVEHIGTAAKVLAPNTWTFAIDPTNPVFAVEEAAKALFEKRVNIPGTIDSMDFLRSFFCANRSISTNVVLVGTSIQRMRQNWPGEIQRIDGAVLLEE